MSMPRYIAAFSDSSSSRLYRRAVLRREADPSPSHLEMLSSFSFLEKKSTHIFLHRFFFLTSIEKTKRIFWKVAHDFSRTSSLPAVCLTRK